MKQRKPLYWSSAEETRLARYAKQGFTSKVAAEKLKRGHPATRYKAMKLGISFGASHA